MIRGGVSILVGIAWLWASTAIPLRPTQDIVGLPAPRIGTIVAMNLLGFPGGTLLFSDLSPHRYALANTNLWAGAPELSRPAQRQEIQSAKERESADTTPKVSDVQESRESDEEKGSVEWVAIVIAAISLLLSTLALKNTLYWNRYNYLANVWYDLLKIGIDNPDFVDPQKTDDWSNSFKEKELVKYNTYARMCWGYIEDIYTQKFHNKSFYRPTIQQCKKIHYAWFRDKCQLYFADQKFKTFIENINA